MKKTGIVILNFNNSSQTLSCLDSLYQHCKEGNWKVCVVDNSSRQDELEKLTRFCKEAIVVSPQNVGYARGNNLGFKHFEGDEEVDNLLVLNDDTRFTCDIITPMQSYLDGNEDCGVVFPLVLTPDGRLDNACWREQKTTIDLVLHATSLGRFFKCKKKKEDIPPSEAVKTGVPPGSCMMLRKDVFKKLGYLDPNTFLYFEEDILSAKISEEELSCVLLPGISIVHLGAQTTVKQASGVVYRHWRNSYLYFMKNYSKTPSLLRYLLQFRTWPKSLRK